MRRRQRAYILSIPAVSTLSPSIRHLIESILRRRSDGPIIVKERRHTLAWDGSNGKASTWDEEAKTTTWCKTKVETKALWAVFEDQQQAQLTLEDLQHAFSNLAVTLRQEWRRPRAGSSEPPCSCELAVVRLGSPYYHGVRRCERHACLVVHVKGEPEPLPAREPERLATLTCQEGTPPSPRRVPVAKQPLSRRRPLSQRDILTLVRVSGQ